MPEISTEYSSLLLDSSRLARHSGHLQTSWTFLVEAKAIGIENINIDMEEARYLFQKVTFKFHLSCFFKKEQAQAINILKKSISKNFPQMYNSLNNFIRTNQVGDKKAFESFDKRKPFVEVIKKVEIF